MLVFVGAAVSTVVHFVLFIYYYIKGSNAEASYWYKDGYLQPGGDEKRYFKKALLAAFICVLSFAFTMTIILSWQK